MWPTLVQLVQRFPVPGPRRPSREAKQEGGGPGLVQHSIAVRAVHQLKRRTRFQSNHSPSEPGPVFRWLLGRLRVATPETSAPSDKNTCCGHQIISTKAGPVCQRGCNLISISGVFHRINIWTRKNHKRQGHSMRRGDLHRKWVPTMQQHVDSSTWRFVKRTYAPAICTLPLLIPAGRQVSENTKR